MVMLTGLGAALLSALPLCHPEALTRQETLLPVNSSDTKVFVMNIPSAQKTSRGAIMFMHGAGSGSSAIWDLKFRDYSVMRYFACAGYDTYAVDVRGFGGSTMPRALQQDTDKAGPSVRAREVQEDLLTAVNYALKKSSVKTLDLVAWSWGCVVSGMFTTERPKLVRRLVLFAPVYDRKNPKRHKTEKAWRTVNRDQLLDYFDPKREEWSVWYEHIFAMFRFSKGKTLRLPNGPYKDIYGEDAPIWDAKKIKVPVLIIRGDRDRASQASAVQNLYDQLEHAPEKRLVTVAGANHFLPRERKHQQFKVIIHGFLKQDLLSVPMNSGAERK